MKKFFERDVRTFHTTFLASPCISPFPRAPALVGFLTPRLAPAIPCSLSCNQCAGFRTISSEAHKHSLNPCKAGRSLECCDGGVV